MSERDGKKIARWKWVADENGDFYMERWGSGDWVTYKDILAQLAAKDAVIAGLVGALDEAKQSLRTIADKAARIDFLRDLTDIRGYANSRANAAGNALALAAEKGDGNA